MGRSGHPAGDEVPVPLLPSLFGMVSRDIEHMAALWGQRGPERLVKGSIKILLYPRVRAVLWFRLAQTLWANRVLRVFALLIQGHVIRSAGAELHPGATVGPGFNLAHSVGVVVGHEVVAGSGLVLFQNTTLGHGSRPGQPVLGDRVRVMTGASVLGGVAVGDDSVVAAGAVVVSDVPARHVAMGIPARIRPRTDL